MSTASSNDAPRVRVRLPTYRRRAMLPRALASLRAQTETRWVCDLHNDDPADPFPETLVAQCADPRVRLVTHARNLGAAAMFDLVYQPVPEPFFALLEDDNWWEPTFLAEMLAAADANPDVNVFWSNMRVWEEQPDGSLRDTGRSVAPETPGEPQRVPWGDTRQLFGALHSHGAALFRSAPDLDLAIPEVPSAAIEMFRERLFAFPLLRLPRPLANFTITRGTSRSRDPAEWAVVQAFLAASFLKHAGYEDTRLAQLCAEARAARPPATTTLLLASLIEPACRDIRRHATLADWWLLLRGALRRPGLLPRVLQSRQRHAEWWEFLDRHTAARFREAAAKRSPASPPG